MLDFKCIAVKITFSLRAHSRQQAPGQRPLLRLAARAALVAHGQRAQRSAQVGLPPAHGVQEGAVAQQALHALQRQPDCRPAQGSMGKISCARTPHPERCCQPAGAACTNCSTHKTPSVPALGPM